SLNQMAAWAQSVQVSLSPLCPILPTTPLETPQAPSYDARLLPASWRMSVIHRPAYRLPGVPTMAVRAAIAIALCVAVPRTATAQVIQQLLGKKPASVTSPDSPRASLSAFLEYSQAGDFARAAQYLDVPEIERSQASQLAREFSIVLDRYVYI